MENSPIDDETVKKFREGYPQDSIIFSDDVTAVLVQHKDEAPRCEMTDTARCFNYSTRAFLQLPSA